MECPRFLTNVVPVINILLSFAHRIYTYITMKPKVCKEFSFFTYAMCVIFVHGVGKTTNPSSTFLIYFGLFKDSFATFLCTFFRDV